MCKMGLPANDLPRRSMARGPIAKRFTPHDNHREISRAVIASLALMLAPVSALADPLVTLPAPGRPDRVEQPQRELSGRFLGPR